MGKYLIPEKIGKLDLSIACHIHDIDYQNKRIDRYVADKRFLNNLFTALHNVKNAKESEKFFYFIIIHIYYYSVRIFGWIFRRKK